MKLFRRAGSDKDTGAFGSVKVMQHKELDAAMSSATNLVSQWDATKVTLVKPLMDAARNHGQVLLMKDTTRDNRLMAVKRMPTRWVRSGPKEFDEKYPTASEKPWHDVGFVQHLSTVGFPYVCELLGLYRSPEDTYVATTFCTQGDLFCWCDLDSTPAPGQEREDAIKPIATQIFSGVRWLHELGIAHRDLSLENILLIGTGDEAKVKIIDFGMATLKRLVRNEVRGKHSYQAPEMHTSSEIDTFLADDFALGVTLFAMAVQDYPWTCTKKGKCQLFEYVNAFGLRRFCDKRRLRKGQGEFLSEVFSPTFLDTVDSLLQLTAKGRACLGEAVYKDEVKKKRRSSVWDLGFIDLADAVLPTKSGTSQVDKLS
mmetsp:Transcript_93803/g.271085  ORF Transcript_93803/g.271085 Transcript_93803/m.271085 type:complete len:371 (-) Transcript_93803:113-1225(-)|eukprot:CAMPEP_0176079102 /NCGR_PEP_ID=MMETSP0120_2-20121206/39561_1 /TAXON_ID=160619 /ORGANISM="Kryptoperidinium foliaceum, Strain CCMP 1326" /LENGTH=370 /DNA_ID=CAMNT_0017412855 /DNA_START=64 /DNA_END=1176 /DNA_ORIENTATION=-